MAFPSVAFCRYPAKTSWKWRSEDWGASRFIKAIKHKPFNGYANIRILDREIRINAASAPQARRWFADLVFDYLTNRQHDLEPPFFFVPIPDSGCAVDTEVEPRMLEVGDNLVGRFGGSSEVRDILRWREAMQPSHAGGYRFVGRLYDNLIVT